jgi:hypothetical protein
MSEQEGKSQQKPIYGNLASTRNNCVNSIELLISLRNSIRKIHDVPEKPSAIQKEPDKEMAFEEMTINDKIRKIYRLSKEVMILIEENEKLLSDFV